MTTFTDQTGRSVGIPQMPARIVSLVPSITELLCDLGLENRLVGITKFCIHPESAFTSKVRVGGTKNFDPEKIRALKPDLILANKEENPKKATLSLAESFPVWVSDIATLADAQEMINQVGVITHTQQKASQIRQSIKSGFDVLKERNKSSNATALYLIWKDPYMAAGTDTFISDVLLHTGFQNVLKQKADQGLRYPRLELAEIEALSPDYILLSSEPYPFKEEHIADLMQFAKRKCVLVDGEAFSWYGSRMLSALPYLNRFAQDVVRNL
jgi:ABC-type Fe3+-hydroxamate transport system substrate-binding protein